MTDDVITLPVPKKSRRRIVAANRPRAEVLQMADYCRPQTVVEMLEQRVARLEKMLDDIAHHLISTTRILYSSKSQLSLTAPGSAERKQGSLILLARFTIKGA